MVDDIKITYGRLEKLDNGLLDITTASTKTSAQQTTPSCVRDTGAPKVQAQGGETNGTPGKRKGISPLQAEAQQKENQEKDETKPLRTNSPGSGSCNGRSAQDPIRRYSSHPKEG